ncbi:antA/AntB antirepressor family protein [Corynebacterium phoceense]|uniref:antA/AntB antirepressor family protein n=1 Tax=Corynebacterium phoceense TaxID=1686286 RepID=UPI0034CEC838
MNELIPLTERDGVQAVLGRDLHAFLEVRDNYTDWMKRMIAYGFSAGQDFSEISDKPKGAGRPRIDHIVSLDMAKEISMIQRTEKGKQARAYFIECERRVKSSVPAIPQTYAEALRAAADNAERAERAEAEARALEVPAKSWGTLAAAGGDYSVAEAAKTLSRDPNIRIGRDQLFAAMRDAGWIFRTKGRRAHWEAYQDKAINTGRLVHKLSRPFLNERTGEMEQPSPTVRVTPKGLNELHVLLGGSNQSALEVAS